MKIAIPTNDRKTIAEKTGQCKEFAIVEINKKNIHYNYVANNHDHNHEDNEEHEHSHGKIIKLLAGVDILFVKNVGKYMKNDLKNNHIEYKRTSETEIINIIDNYKKGEKNENSNSK